MSCSMSCQGRGTATLRDKTEVIGPGDVIFVPKGAVHRIENLDNGGPLRVGSKNNYQVFVVIHLLQG